MILLMACGWRRITVQRTHNKDIISPAAHSPEGDELLVRLTLKRQIEELPFPQSSRLGVN